MFIVTKSLRSLMRWIALPLGGCLFIMGAITFALPVPSGIPLMVAGVAVAAINPLALRWIKRARKRFPRINANIRRVTPHMPHFIRRKLTRTDHTQI